MFEKLLKTLVFTKGKFIKKESDLIIVSKSQLDFRYHKDEKGKIHFELLKEFTVVFSNGMKDYRVEAPKGFISDGASIPRAFLAIVRSLQILPAAIIHDYLFSSKGKIEDLKRDGIGIYHKDSDYSFSDANLIFFKLLRFCDVSKAESVAAYEGVSTYIGKKHWNKG